MKRRVNSVMVAAAACLAFAAVTGLAYAGNPHGTPPGQETKQDSSSSSSSSSSSAQTQTQTAPKPQDKYAGCTASDSQGAGVKPNNTTKHNTCATADSKQTKLYGNGKTAGGIAMSRGASGDTKLYGPGNSQPHKVATCPDKHGKVHYKDVHAVKSYPASGCASSSTKQTQQTQQQTQQTQQTSSQSSTQQSTVTGTAGVSAASTPAASAAPGQSGVLGAQATVHKAPGKSAPRNGVLGATTRTGTLPFTGLPLWIPALAAFAMLGTGLALRRRARSEI